MNDIVEALKLLAVALGCCQYVSDCKFTTVAEGIKMIADNYTG